MLYASALVEHEEVFRWGLESCNVSQSKLEVGSHHSCVLFRKMGGVILLICRQNARTHLDFGEMTWDRQLHPTTCRGES
jgi:hypothetical protein